MTDDEHLRYNTSQFEMNTQGNASTSDRKFTKPSKTGGPKEQGVKITVAKKVAEINYNEEAKDE